MLKRARRLVLALAACSALMVPAVVLTSSGTAFAATCGQPAHVWWATPGGSLGGGNTITLAPGSPAWATGVVAPGTQIFYFTTDGFFFVNGQNETAFSTTAADGNCVVHHDLNQIFIPPQAGPIDVYASYDDWQTGWTETFVGEINIG
jgi:hypothetical protein